MFILYCSFCVCSQYCQILGTIKQCQRLKYKKERERKEKTPALKSSYEKYGVSSAQKPSINSVLGLGCLFCSVAAESKATESTV